MDGKKKDVPSQGMSMLEEIIRPVKACARFANLWLIGRALSFLNVVQVRKQHDSVRI